MLEKACRELSELLPGRVRAGESMKNHTTFRIGGPADIFIWPASREELRAAVGYAFVRGIPLTVIGAGSNLLVGEGGIRGIVVKVGRGLDRVTRDGAEIRAEAGARLAKVAAIAQINGLGGFEFTAGIPGTVGGAVVMNAGANGSSIGDIVKGVLVLNHAGQFKEIPQAGLGFGYRKSILQEKPLIVIEASFSCRLRSPQEIRKEMKEYIEKRKRTQPLSLPSAGSIFKNPPGDSAGRLIEAAGLKGKRVGGAIISEVHANFIVNLGSATARDVRTLIEMARSAVWERFGVELALEVKIIGED